MKTQITICGGGNAAHTLAGLLSGNQNVLIKMLLPYGAEAEMWWAGIAEEGGITVQSPKGRFFGRPEVISNQPQEVIPGAQIVFFALPAFAHQAMFNLIQPYLDKGAWICALPARSGFDIQARTILQQHKFTLVGFQTLPWACRIEQYGRRAVILGVKSQVDIAVWPAVQAQTVKEELTQLLGIPLTPIASFLSLALADTGQIIHPGIMFGLFSTWDGSPYPEPVLFYQNVDARIADTLSRLSAEIQMVSRALANAHPGLDVSAVHTLKDWLLRSYAPVIKDNSTLQSCFQTNQGYAGLTAPMKKVESGYLPDFQARYLAEDVPYNLLVTRGIAELAGLQTPVIDQVISWAQNRLGKVYLQQGTLSGPDLAGSRCPQAYGFSNLDSFMKQMDYYT